MNIKKTKIFYDRMKLSEICQCDYCQNYVSNVGKSYHELSKTLADLGVDIKKPFETNPLEPDEKGNIEYVSVQYIVMGNKADFNKISMPGVDINVAICYPSTNIKEDHFVIEISSIVLKWEEI